MKESEEIIDNIEDGFEDEDTLENRYLTFRVNNEHYALEIRHVTEILGVQKITRVPNTRDFIIGIMNLRGIIYPVLDVRRRFGIPTIEWNDRTCIVVIQVDNVGLGLLVDEVSEVVTMPPETISEAPSTNKGAQSKFIAGIGKLGDALIILLDIYRLLWDDFERRDVDPLANPAAKL